MKVPSKTILSFLDNLGIEIKNTSEENEIRINSIYSNDNKYKLYISLDKGVYHCFKSGEGGKVEKLFSHLLNIDEREVLPFLIKNFFSKNHEVVKNIVEKEETLEIPEGLKFFNSEDESSLGIISLRNRKNAYNYLARRGISEKNINELGYISGSSNIFNNRIFIPFYEDEKLVYYQTRDFTGLSKLRYINPKGFSSKEFVFNIDKINDEVVLVEGLFDAMSVDNIPATAIMSADLTLNQAKKIMFKAPKDIIIVPDNDETGFRTLPKNIELLNYIKPKSLNYNIWLYHLPNEFKDFNEYALKSNDFNIDKKKLIKYNKNRFFGNFDFSKSNKNLI